MFFICSGNTLTYTPYRTGQPSCGDFGLKSSRKYQGLCSKYFGVYHLDFTKFFIQYVLGPRVFVFITFTEKKNNKQNNKLINYIFSDIIDDLFQPIIC